MLNVDHWPTLDRPLLVVALSGWVDAGVAGEGAVHALVEQLTDADEFGALDLTDLLDLQQTRPTARFVEGSMRVIDWPALQFVAGRAGRDVVVVHGPEPSLRWPAVADDHVDIAIAVADADELPVRIQVLRRAVNAAEAMAEQGLLITMPAPPDVQRWRDWVEAEMTEQARTGRAPVSFRDFRAG